MRHEFPEYYKEFFCVAGECEATCCAGWQIVADEESLRKYKKVKGNFKERIKNGVNFKEGVFFQDEEKRCAFLNRENLCDMYTALGEGALCETCTRYPRHTEEFENVREHTLSISCPTAARMVLLRKEPVRFYSEEEKGEEEVFDDFDPAFYEMLAEVRKEMIQLLQDRALPLKLRMSMIWRFAVQFQEAMDEGMLYVQEKLWKTLKQEEYIERGKKVCECWEKDMDTAFSDRKTYFLMLFELEVLQNEWKNTLVNTWEYLYSGTKEEYERKKREFEEWRCVDIPDWDIYMEQLMVYFLYTYFCGAVYDEYVASKAKLAVLSAFYAEEFLCSEWEKNDKKLEQQDIIRMIYRYSRELEHSDLNLCAMDRMLEELVSSQDL